MKMDITETTGKHTHPNVARKIDHMREADLLLDEARSTEVGMSRATLAPACWSSLSNLSESKSYCEIPTHAE